MTIHRVKPTEISAIPEVYKELTAKLDKSKNLQLFTTIFSCVMGMVFAAFFKYLSPSRIRTGFLFGSASTALIAVITLFSARKAYTKEALVHNFLSHILKLQFNDAVESSKLLVNPNHWNYKAENITNLESSGMLAFIDAPRFKVARAIHQAFRLMAFNKQIEKAAFEKMRDQRNIQAIKLCENDYRLFKALSLAAGKKIFNSREIESFTHPQVKIPKDLLAKSIGKKLFELSA